MFMTVDKSYKEIMRKVFDALKSLFIGMMQLSTLSFGSDVGEQSTTCHPCWDTTWFVGDLAEQQCSSRPNPEMSGSLLGVKESHFPKVFCICHENFITQ